MPAIRLPVPPCSASLKIESEGQLGRAARIGTEVTGRLHAIKARRVGRSIGDAGALGAMIAFDLVTSHGGNEPDAAEAKQLVADYSQKACDCRHAVCSATPSAC